MTKNEGAKADIFLGPPDKGYRRISAARAKIFNGS
jgi:hypothetical protein